MAAAGAAADREGHPEERGEGVGEVEETDQGTAHQGEGQENVRESQCHFMIPTTLHDNVLYCTFFFTHFTTCRWTH